ncbi:cytosolic Cu/Zn superoxide dismutase [Cordyceps militaris CM01]|uniref:superoxide dismutase n=2 Tax=Cordyceps militaris TaxID=73501 RepID=G3JLX1_CORMM|nr:cytosolic Cu/Zn superoxide dismutase [Cordyceps militaris CM01]ATY62350.1 cytosolic Cu Zn superoxide dismutase [Cordyceps militaris]EGX90695.1 cytosolic Cu/Zn superoxide dismutase [Cordyceps militaris CM01]
MYSKTLFAIVSAALVGNAAAYEDAKIINNNPHGVTYSGTLPDKPFFKGADLAGNVVGSISATAAENGVGTKFTVKFSNFPKSGGPFIYHLHVKPAVGGNCTATLGHLDPTKRGDLPACESDKPASCQVGDLSGKYGKITTDPFTAEFTDPFTSLEPGSNAFFGNASFVVHYANTTRLTCADFHLVNAPEPDCGGGHAQPSGGYVSPVPSGTAGTGTPTYGNPVPTVPLTAGASKMAIAAPLFALGAAAMML